MGIWIRSLHPAAYPPIVLGVMFPEVGGLPLPPAQSHRPCRAPFIRHGRQPKARCLTTRQAHHPPPESRALRRGWAPDTCSAHDAPLLLTEILPTWRRLRTLPLLLLLF